ncbi:unnamed protein product [Didymodactylos carnosus]|uniref:Ig-like domain-containing protein n=1 Tax=Didymodactylos carnosus TaxID=1234261 RepID=A0A813NKN9_9BILA|nr:unnamed protein product [Didymodactylos carnosus]CAF0915423.1 unnamed protein product [Didymodactylos carnosus]CAF3517036.1 unnamed protein product [Didymodactylos carnosus]CAF3693768.1 unnamed protein product [Didymodactylos carnosus]
MHTNVLLHCPYARNVHWYYKQNATYPTYRPADNGDELRDTLQIDDFAGGKIAGTGNYKCIGRDDNGQSQESKEILLLAQEQLNDPSRAVADDRRSKIEISFVHQGKQLSIKCPYKADHDEEILWEFKAIDFGHLTPKEYTFADGKEKYRRENNQPTTSSTTTNYPWVNLSDYRNHSRILIKNLTIFHTGEYRCRLIYATTKRAVKTSHIVELIVVFTLLSPWNDTKLMFGSSFEKHCVTNWPNSLLRIIKEDGDVQHPSLNIAPGQQPSPISITSPSSITIDSVGYEHEGMYTCQAILEHRLYQSWSFFLNIYGQPMAISGFTNSSRHTAKEYEMVVLKCGIKADPGPKYQWLFKPNNSTLFGNVFKPINEYPFSSPREGHSYLFNFTASAVRDGEYMCIATNEYSTMTSHMIFSTEKGVEPLPVKRIYSLPNLLIPLTCTLKEYPRSKIIWERRDELNNTWTPITNSSGISPNIHRHQEASMYKVEGYYRCAVIIGDQVLEYGEQLQLITSLALDIKRSNWTGNAIMFEGDSLNRTCYANRPDAETIIIDMRHNEAIHEHELVIERLHINDSGIYICIADVFGKLSTNWTFKLVVRPADIVEIYLQSLHNQSNMLDDDTSTRPSQIVTGNIFSTLSGTTEIDENYLNNNNNHTENNSKNTTLASELDLTGLHEDIGIGISHKGPNSHEISVVVNTNKKSNIIVDSNTNVKPNEIVVTSSNNNSIVNNINSHDVMPTLSLDSLSAQVMDIHTSPVTHLNINKTSLYEKSFANDKETDNTLPEQEKKTVTEISSDLPIKTPPNEQQQQEINVQAQSNNQLQDITNSKFLKTDQHSSEKAFIHKEKYHTRERARNLMKEKRTSMESSKDQAVNEIIV